MKKGTFSRLTSLLNSCYHNGYGSTFKILADLALIKFRFKDHVKLKKFDAPIFLRRGSSDLQVFRQIFMDYEYDFFIEAEKVKTILDGGCNIGLASLYFAKRCPSAAIVGLEPDDENFKVAIRNTAHQKNISLIKAGIWSKSCFLKTVMNPELGEWAISVAESDAGAPGSIRARTIPQIMEENKWTSIDILKLDVEGAEEEIFNPDSIHWLKKTRVLVIELHDRFKAGSSMKFFRALTESGIRFSYSMSGENVIVTNLSF